MSYVFFCGDVFLVSRNPWFRLCAEAKQIPYIFPTLVGKKVWNKKAGTKRGFFILFLQLCKEDEEMKKEKGKGFEKNILP